MLVILHVKSKSDTLKLYNLYINPFNTFQYSMRSGESQVHLSIQSASLMSQASEKSNCSPVIGWGFSALKGPGESWWNLGGFATLKTVRTRKAFNYVWNARSLRGTQKWPTVKSVSGPDLTTCSIEERYASVFSWSTSPCCKYGPGPGPLQHQPESGRRHPSSCCWRCPWPCCTARRLRDSAVSWRMSWMMNDEWSEISLDVIECLGSFLLRELIAVWEYDDWYYFFWTVSGWW